MFPSATAPSSVELKSAIIRDPLVVAPNTPVIEAITQMSDLHSRCAIANTAHDRLDELHLMARSSCAVVMQGKRLAGMLTERDVVRLNAQNQPLNQLVMQQVMTHPVIALRESEFTDLSAVVNLLQKNRIRHLPILDEQDYPVGLVTYDSLQRAITRHQLQAELHARQEAESRLQESEKRYASLVTAAPVGIFRTDIWGRCVYVNEQYCQITGCTPENLAGEGWTIGCHPDDRNWVAAKWEHSVQTAQPFQCECCYQSSNSSYGWVYVQAAPEFDVEGHVNGYVGTLTDISNRKQAELALKQSEAQSRTVLSTIPDLMFRVGADSVYREFVSPCRDFDILPEGFERIGRTMSELLPAELAERHTHYLQQALQAGEMQVYEQCVQIGDRLQYEEVRVVKSGEDEALFIIRDISERKRIELALEQSELTNRTLIETIPDLLIQMDRAGNYCRMSGGSGVLVKYPSDACTGPEVYDVLPPDLAEQRLHYAHQALEGGRLQIYEQIFDFEGEQRYEEVRIAPLNTQEVLIIIRDITDRKQTERQLAASENKFRSIFDYAAVGIAQGSLQTEIQSPNPRFCEMLGYTEAELAQLTVADITHPDDRAMPDLSRLMAGEISHFSMEKRCLRKDGTVMWSNVTFSLLQDEAGNPLNFIAVVQDISDRKRAEAALEEREQRFRQLFEATPKISVQGYNRHHQIIYWNDASEALYGYTRAEAIGQTLEDLIIPPEMRSWVNEGVQTWMKGGPAIPAGELNLMRKDGSRVDVFSSHILLTNPAGEPEMYCVDIDLSELKRTEIALQESEMRWQFALEGAGDGVWDWNLQTEVAFFSQRWKAMLGYADNEVSNHFEEWASRIHPDDKARCFAVLNSYFEGETQTYQNEYRLRCKNGDYKWILTRGKVVECSGDGQPLRMIGTHKDISDRKQTEVALHALIEGTAATTGQDFFPALVRHIAAALDVQYAVVTEKIDDKLRTLAFWAHEEFQPNFSFNLIGTPCEPVLQEGEFYCEYSIQQQFPDHSVLVEMAAESYFGMALRNAQGEAIGTLCIISRQPIRNPQWAKQILSVFAARAGAELERQRTSTLLEQLNRVLGSEVEDRSAALRASETKIRTIIEAIPDLLLRVTRNGTCMDAIQSRYQTGEFLPVPRHLSEVLPPDLLQQQLDRIDEAIATRTLQVYEHQLEKHGRLVYEEVRISALSSDEVLIIVRDITNRKQVEAELEASRTYYQSIIADQTELICRFLPDGTFTFVNDAYCQFFQKSREELLGHSFTPLVPDEDKDIAVQHANSLSVDNTVVTYEHRVIKPDGTIAWQQWTERAMFDAEGNFFEFQAVGRDITALKEAEEALRESEQRFRRAVEDAPFPIMLHAEDGEVLQINTTWSDLTGYTYEDIPTTRAWAQQAYGDRAASILANRITQIYSFESRQDEGELSITRKDGNQCIWQFSSAPLGLLPDGRRVAISMAADTTQRRQAESALRESEARLNLAVESAAIGIWDWNITNNTLVWDERMYTLYGLTPESFQDVYEAWFASIHPDDRASVAAASQQALQGEQDYDTEFRVVHSDGNIRHIKANALVQRNSLGEPQRMIGINYDITDRKETEFAMRQQLAAMEAAIDSIAILRGETFIYVNQAKLTMLGYEHPEELIGRSWRSLYSLAEGERYEREIRPALERYRSWEGEVVAIRKDSSTFFEELSLTITEDGLLICVCRDISERKRAEAELEASRAYYQGIIADQTELICRFLPDGTLTFVNDAYCSFFQKASTELVGQSFTPLLSDDDRLIVNENFNSLSKDNPVITYEHRVVSPEGSVCWQQWTDRALFDSEGNFIEFQAVGRDITALKEAEAKVRSLLNQAQLLNRISSEIRDSLHLEIILQTSVNLIVAELPADICTFAWYHGETGSSIWEVVKEQKNPELPSWLGSHHLNEFPTLLEHILQNQIYRIDSSTALEDASLKRFFDNAGITTCLCLPIHTIGGKIGSLQIGRITSEQSWQAEEIKLLEGIGDQLAIAIYQAHLYEESQAKTKELQRSYRDLQETQLQLIQSEKMSSLGQLVAGIAHEINNPMSFIYGNLEPALDYAQTLAQLIRKYQETYPSPSEAIAQFIKTADIEYILSDFPKLLASMETGATRIQDIIQSLRTFSRLDRAECKSVNLHENIDSTLVILQNRLNGRAGKPEITVVKNYSNLPLIECYGSLLNQVFMNLLVNAIDAIEERQVNSASSYTGYITITTAVVSDDKVTISIRDNGMGMMIATQAKIFNPFFTTKPVGVGTGMGLPISYQIVTGNHQGQLRCYSTPGEGTEFIVELWQSLRQLDMNE